MNELEIAGFTRFCDSNSSSPKRFGSADSDYDSAGLKIRKMLKLKITMRLHLMNQVKIVPWRRMVTLQKKSFPPNP